jgi:hypothetical protein
MHIENENSNFTPTSNYMKSIIFLFLLSLPSLAFAQVYEDTLVLKSGVIRLVSITQVNNNSIKYRYRNSMGNSIPGVIRKNHLQSYSIRNERVEFKPEFTNINLGHKDTIYFSYGEERIVQVLKMTKTIVRYEYVTKEGKISRGYARKGMIDKVLIGDPLSPYESYYSMKED